MRSPSPRQVKRTFWPSISRIRIPSPRHWRRCSTRTRLASLRRLFPENSTIGLRAANVHRSLRLPRENRPEPPRPCFGVLDDAFLITEREVLYRKAVATAETPGDSLGEALDFKLVVSKIGRRSGGVKPAMIAFSRPEEGMRFLYEMVTGERARENIRRGGERNAFFKSVHSAMESNPLPPFSVLEQYFAPAGALMVDDETGLHYMSFTLRRK